MGSSAMTELGRADQQRCHGEHLLLAARQAAGGDAAALVEDGEPVVGFAAVTGVAEPELEVLFDRHGREDASGLGGEQHVVGPPVGFHQGDVVAVEEDRSRVGVIRPLMTLHRVDLPAPLAPTRAVMLPGRSDRSMSKSTVISP